MSKMDALRAMREAGHEQAMARHAARAAGQQGATAPVVRPRAAPSPKPVPAPEPTADACGHRSMNGRTCTREPGHAAKSHRYS